MRRLFSAVAVLACTVALLSGLVLLNPFDAGCDALDRLFGAPPKWTQVTNVYRDSRTQEVTRGDDAMHSMELLTQYWHEHQGADKIVFMGNSQMHVISLASGEPPATTPEKTYVDLVVDQLRATAPDELVYRFSTSGMSYPEVLWELSFMISNRDLRPNTVVLQMNYQAFWTGGIRDSLLPMLRQQLFRARIENLAASGRADAPVYQDALRRFDEMQAKQQRSPSNTAAATGLTAAFSMQATPGYSLETTVRGWLEQLFPEQQRAGLKESFTNVLYRSRLYLLRLKPSTARSINGSRLLIARSAVDSIAQLCTTNHMRLILFHAPVNPNVALYRTPEDRKSYHEFVAGISAQYHLPLFDFENSISAVSWGRLLNGPDPLHMGRTAHHEMARQIVDEMNLVEVRN